MVWPKNCMAGRMIIREDRLGGLDWQTSCRVPPECMLPTDPPLYFCVPHYEAAVDEVWTVFDGAGLIDHGIVAGPPDEFDRLIERLREGR